MSEHEHEIAVATGASMEADGSISVVLKAVGLEEDEAVMLLSLLRETTRMFTVMTGGETPETTTLKAGSADEAIAVLHSRDATKQ